MKKLAYVLILGLVFVVLAGCSDDERYQLGPRQWKDIQVLVETRPSPARVGMNEFIVMTSKGRQPAFDLVVSLRMDRDDPWKQSVQDGHIGVFRRALKVGNPQSDVLYVQLRKDDETQELQFPLNQQFKQAAK